MTKKRSNKHDTAVTGQKSRSDKRDILKARLVFYAFGFSGAAALIYEVLWTRELSLVFGSTVYAVSTMLTAFMAGLSVGSYFGGRMADRMKNLVFVFGSFEIGIGVFGLLTIPLINFLPTLYFLLYNNINMSFFSYHLIQFVLCFLIMIIPTSLMGATFPVVSKIQTASMEELGRGVGGVYSINTVGSIFGSFLPGFVLIPILGTKATTLVAASLNLAVAALLIILSGKRTRFSIIAGALVAFTFLGSVGLMWDNRSLAFNWSMLKNFSTYEEFKEFKDDSQPVYFGEDSHGTVAVYKRKSSGDLYLVNGGRIEGGSRGTDMQTTSLLSYIPVASVKDPQSALVIGLGTGNTLKETTRFGLKRIVCAEIVAKVVPAAKLFIGEEVFDDPRLNMVIADARNYLYTTNEKFDVITSEPSHPTNTAVTNLFTYDFYDLAKSRMSDDGVFAQWIPRYLLKKEDFIFMLKTFKAAFPHTVVWASYADEEQARQQMYPVETIFVGSQRPFEVDPAKVKERIAPIAKESGQTLYYGVYLDEKMVAEVLRQLGADAPINTDDKPVLEFVVPHNIIDFAYQEKTSI